MVSSCEVGAREWQAFVHTGAKQHPENLEHGSSEGRQTSISSRGFEKFLQHRCR